MTRDDNSPETSLNRPQGMSTDDWRYNAKRAENAAKWAEKQRQERDAQPVDSGLRAARMRVEMYQQKVNQTGLPHEKARAEKLLAEAQGELSRYERDLDQQARQAERKATVTENERYKNAVEHAEATARIIARRGDDDEHVSALTRLKLLQGAEPETLESTLSNYWAGVAAFENRETLAEQSKLTETTKATADQMKKQSEAEIAAADARHRADFARLNSGE